MSIEKIYKDEIIDLYKQGIGSYTIAKKYGCSRTHICNLLNKWEITKNPPKRKYNFNENFFDNIGPDQAYILGFLYADGCNYVP